MLAKSERGVVEAFLERFKATPRLFAAPGRINIIGEHTDYSGGFVMPAAIDRRCVVAVATSGDSRMSAFSLARNQCIELPPDFARTGTWIDYISAVRQVLRDKGIDVPGCNLAIHSDVPEGAGVSSSAALEVAVMKAMLAAASITALPRDLAVWAQEAESTYVGMPCGLMDQFIATHGVAGNALVLDCRSLNYALAPLPASSAFLVIDSTVRHRLRDGGYAARRADCEAAATALGIASLRDATADMLRKAQLSDRLLKRARHVVSENMRVSATATALAGGNLEEAGRLMVASHNSLRDDFEVTCVETDILAAVAGHTTGVYGARQMGGGFGGAVLALVDAGQVDSAASAIQTTYRQMTGNSASFFVCAIAGGACEVTP